MLRGEVLLEPVGIYNHTFKTFAYTLEWNHMICIGMN